MFGSRTSLSKVALSCSFDCVESKHVSAVTSQFAQ